MLILNLLKASMVMVFFYILILHNKLLICSMISYRYGFFLLWLIFQHACSNRWNQNFKNTTSQISMNDIINVKNPLCEMRIQQFVLTLMKLQYSSLLSKYSKATEKLREFCFIMFILPIMLKQIPTVNFYINLGNG